MFLTCSLLHLGNFKIEFELIEQFITEMSHWKKLFSQHLISTAKSINNNLKQNNIKNLIEIPKSFHSEKQMIEFSNEIINSISFPQYRYLLK